MLRIVALALVAALALAAGCQQLPDSDGGVATACDLPAAAAGGGTSSDCTMEGEPEAVLVNPLDPSDQSCGPFSVTLFNQSIEAQTTLILGENGFFDAGRIRVGVEIAPGSTHEGELAKAAGSACEATLPPAVAVTTSFGGRHVAIIDREPEPMCIYTSRLTLTSFSQSIELGLNLDVSEATRAGTEASIARQIDLEVAKAVNKLLAPSTEFDADFEARAGRCEDHYWPFTGE